MTGAEMAAWAGTGVVFIGLVATWLHNGKSQAKRDSEIAEKQAQRDQTIATNQQNILKRLDDDDTGLSALNEKINDFNVYCARTSTGLNGRVTAAEREIKELKQR